MPDLSSAELQKEGFIARVEKKYRVMPYQIAALGTAALSGAMFTVDRPDQGVVLAFASSVPLYRAWQNQRSRVEEAYRHTPNVVD